MEGPELYDTCTVRIVQVFRETGLGKEELTWTIRERFGDRLEYHLIVRS